MAADSIAPPPPTPDAVSTEPAADWRAGLSDDLKADKSLADVPDVSTLARRFVDTKKLVGAKLDGMVRVPGKDATPEERTAFNTARGVPDSPDGYDLTPLKGLPVDEGRAKNFLVAAHKLGYTNEQAVGLVQWAVDAEQRELGRKHEGYLAGQDTLVDEWGELLFNRRSQQVERLLKQYAPPEYLAHLTATKEISHPGLLKMLAPIAQQFAESRGLVDGDSGGGETAAEVATKITDMRAKLTTLDRGSPEYKTLMAQFEHLIKLEESMQPKP